MNEPIEVLVWKCQYSVEKKDLSLSNIGENALELGGGLQCAGGANGFSIVDS